MDDLDLFVKTHIHHRWEKEVAGAEEVLIFSPYITGRTAYTVCSKIPKGVCTIYTKFSFFLFVNQSSSIKTLIKLKEAGHRIFRLKEVHAKMVIVPGRFASIGSQNLTDHGTQNLEASVAFTDPDKIAAILEEAVTWTDEAYELSLETLLDMERLVAPFVRRYKALLKEGEDVDEEVKTSEEERAEKKRKKLADEEKKRARTNAEWDKKKYDIQETVRLLDSSDEIVRGVIRNQKPKHEKKSFYTLSVRDPRNEDLIHWTVAGENISLTRLYRYPFLMEDTGKIGWVRVGGRQISFYGHGVRNVESTHIGGIDGELSYSGVWPPNKKLQSNMIIGFKVGSKVQVNIHCWFGLDKLEVKDTEICKGTYSLKAESFREWVNDHVQDFQEEVQPQILNSFKYERKLIGVKPESFFYTEENIILKEPYIRLVLVDKYPVLVASKRYPYS